MAARLTVTLSGAEDVSDVRQWLDVLEALQFSHLTPVLLQMNGDVSAGMDAGDLDLSGFDPTSD